MRLRWWMSSLLVAVFVGPVVAVAGDAKTPPLVNVRVQSIDEVLANVKHFAKLAGLEDFGPQLDGLIKAKVGPKGLVGVDTKRPLAAYFRVGDDLTDLAAVVMVPIADEKEFLGLLENVNQKFKKDGDVYKLEPVPGLEVGFRFLNQYAYITALNFDAISKERVLAPSALFKGGSKELLAGTIRLDQVPKAAQQLVLAKLEEESAKLKDMRNPGETDTQKKLRHQIVDSLIQQIAQLLNEGADITGVLDIDRANNQLIVDVNVGARPNSKLHDALKDLGANKSVFGTLPNKSDLLAGVMHVSLPEAVRKVLGPVFDEATAKAVMEEKDAAKRKLAEMFLKKIEPTFKRGELDTALVVRSGKDKQLTVIAGIRLEAGDALGDAIVEFVQTLPEKERKLIKLGEATVDGIKIHRLDAQQQFDAKAKALFGDNPIYVAFRKDVLLVTLGVDGLAAMKDAVAAKPQAGSVIYFETSAAQLLPLVAKTAEEKEALEKFFRTVNDPSRIRVSLQGGDRLQLRAAISLEVVRAGIQLKKDMGGN